MHTGLIILGRPGFEQIYGDEHLRTIASRIKLLAQPMTREEAIEHPDLLEQAEVIFCGWGGPIMNEQFLTMTPRLKAVFYGAGSIRAYVSEAFWTRGIVITSAYAANAVPVAEYTHGVISLSLKNFWFHSHQIKQTRCLTERIPSAGGYGSRVGIISLGMIGRLVCQKLRDTDLEVLAYDPYVNPDEADRLGVRLVSLDDIFRECDVVSLHTPRLKETEGMISGRHFELMKPRATFINTARGAVVNEPEMIDALQRRPDVSAVLDVTWPETPVTGSPLYTLPNVVITPHIAGSLNRECRRMGRLMIEEFDRWERGEPMQWAVSEQYSLTMA